MNKNACAFIVCALCGFSVFGGSWQPVNGDWNGTFSDLAHWNGGFAQDGKDNSISAETADVTVRVTTPTETTARLYLDGYANHPAILDATGTSLLFATQTVDTAAWPEAALYGRFDGYTFFKPNSNDARWSRQAQAKLTDVAVKMWSPADGIAEMRVTGGSAGVFDFVHPDPRGDTKDPNGARPTLNLFVADYYKPAKSAYNHCRLAFENTTAYLPSVTFQSYPTVAEIAVSGGSLDIAGNLAVNASSNVFTLSNGARFEGPTGGTWNLASSPNDATLVVDMADGCEMATKMLTVGGDRRLNVRGGRLGLTSGNELLAASGDVVTRFQDMTVSHTGEMKFTLSDNARLETTDATLTNPVKFTVKTTGNAALSLRGGSLATPLMAGADRSRIGLDGVDIAVDNWGLSNARVGMTNCTLSAQSALAFSGTDGAYLLTNVTGVTAAKTFYISGSNVVTFTADSLDRALLVNGGNNHGQIGAGPYGELNLEGGTFEFRPAATSQRINLGHGNASYTGVLNVKGGRLVSKVAQDGSTRSFGLGITHGTGFITVSGGEVDVSGLCICTEDSGNAKESAFRQTGGLVKIAPCDYEASCQSRGLCATGNNKKTRKARIALDGGVTEVSVVAGGTSGQCRGGTGWTAFEANGGTVRVNKANAQILRDFDEATLGVQGLTVDGAGYACTIAQNLASAPGATGRLVLTGAGTKTISGTSAVELVAAGGTVAFAAGADNTGVDLVVTNGAAATFAAGGAKNRTFASLVLGDATTPAILELTAGEPLTVLGDVDVARVSLRLSGSFATGAGYDLLTCGGTVSDASAAAWRQALIQGLGTDQGCDLSVTTDGAGRMVLKMSVRERQNLTIDVPAFSESNLVDAVTFAAADTLTVNVGERGALNATGAIGNGALVKTGTGRATFDHPEDLFAGGVTVRAGQVTLPWTASFADPVLMGSAMTVGTGTLALGRAGAAPATAAGTLVLATAAASDAAVLACASDVEIAAPTVTQGCFVKRGAGTLTFAATKACAFSPNAGKDVKNTAPAANQLTFDDYGIPPANNYSSLTVAEGDLVLKGTTASASYGVSGSGAVYVGMPVSGIAKPARLVVDGVRTTFEGNHFHVGSGVRTSNCPYPECAFVVTNGGSAVVTSLRVGMNADAGASPRIRVSGTGSDVFVKEYLYLAESAITSATETDPTLLVSAGATMRLPRMDDGNANHAFLLRNQGVGVVDGGTLTDENGREFRVTADGTGGSLIFRNGATFVASELRPNADTANIRLTFDGATWSFGRQRTLTLTRPERVTVTARGKGLVLAPAAGTNLVFNLPVSGSGDLVKRGAGAVTLSAVPTVTGVCRVEEGSLALADGLEATGLAFAGAGALTGGTFRDAVLLAPLGDAGAVTGAVPVLAGATLTGVTHVDLGRTAESPLSAPWPQDVVVAAYTGTAPNVAGWKVRQTGVDRLSASFTAVNGQVRMNLKVTGCVLIFR